MIALYSADRRWHSTIEQALRSHDIAVRTASRPAELAKCLVDGTVRLIIAGVGEQTAAEAHRAAGSLPVVNASPGDTTEDVVRRAIAML